METNSGPLCVGKPLQIEFGHEKKTATEFGKIFVGTGAFPKSISLLLSSDKLLPFAWSCALFRVLQLPTELQKNEFGLCYCVKK